jgi:hypothetical protein
MLSGLVVCKCTVLTAELWQGIPKKKSVYFEMQQKSIYFTLLISTTSHSYSIMCNFHPAGRLQDQALILQQLKQ